MVFLSGFILLIIIWLVLDFWLGRKKHLALARKTETGMLHGDFQIFTHGPKLFPDYFSEIRSAKKHIHIVFYIVKEDAFSRDFFTLLKEKAAAGVEVRLLLDRLGSLKVKKKTIMSLKEAGVEFAFSNRIRLPFLFYSTQVRNHRKITIIDGRIGYLGGFNIGKEYIDGDPDLSPWRDYHVKITAESVNFLQSEFFLDWREYAGVDLQSHPDYFPQLAAGAVRHRFMPTEAGQLEELFISLVKKAEHSLMIGTPYFIPSHRLFHELINAIARGVRITVIVPYKSDHILVQEASYRYLRRLLREGAVVYQYKKGFYHAKTIVVDGKVCDIGTANFDKRSLFLNKEINCLIYDPAFISLVKEILQKDISDSKTLTLAEFMNPNLFRSAKEVLAGALSYFL